MWKKAACNVLALVFGVGLFLVLEGLLALAGIVPLSKDDRFLGFEKSLPLFIPEKTDGTFVYTLNPAKEQYFNPQAFQMPKPDGTVRIAFFGGSTTYGRPYINPTSFPTWVSTLLGKTDTGATYESINAGGISYASYRVNRLVRELAAYSPDLYVIYSGHNEFLEKRTFDEILSEPSPLRTLRSLLHRSRIYSLPARLFLRLKRAGSPKAKDALGEEVMATLEEIGGPDLYHRDPAFRSGVIEQYRSNILSMIRYCREKGIPVVLCTLPANYSGMSPFKSEHREGITPEEEKEWRKAFQRGREAMRERRHQEALALFNEAESIDNRFAELHFRKGQTLAALGLSEEAYHAFSRAKEEDIIPLRALGIFNEIIRETARDEDVPLVDVEGLFRRLSPGSIPGWNIFVDHVHPTLEGQFLIARLIVDRLVEEELVPLAGGGWKAARDDTDRFFETVSSSLPERYRAMGLYSVGRLFNWAGKGEEAYYALRKARETVADEWELAYLLGKLEMARRQPAEAAAFLEEARSLDPGNTKVLFALAETRLMGGEGEEAFTILSSLPGMEGVRPDYHLALSEAYRLLEKRPEALRELVKASALAGEASEVHRLAAAGFGRLGEKNISLSSYQKYLILSRHPNPEEAMAAWRGILGEESPP